MPPLVDAMNDQSISRLTDGMYHLEQFAIICFHEGVMEPLNFLLRHDLECTHRTRHLRIQHMLDQAERALREEN